MFSRRRALGGIGGALVLGAGARWLPGAARQQGPDFWSLDHLEFFATDLSRSLAFYTRLFGADLWKNNQTPLRYLMLGPAYIAIEERPEARVDHFAAGIRDFDIEAVHSFLDSHGVAYRDYSSGRALSIDDADGIRTQLGADHSWRALSGTTASPEPYESAGDPIFTPLGIDHVLLKVGNIGSSSDFYSKFLGPGSDRDGEVWFSLGSSTIRLSAVAGRASAGVAHFAVRVERFDRNTVRDALHEMGLTIEASDLDGSMLVRDPDGLGVWARLG